MNKLRFLLLLLSVLVYLSVRIPPHIWWPAAFISLAIPAVLALNALLLLQSLFRGRKWKAWPYALALLLGAPFIAASIQLNRSLPAADNTFSVMSYNVRVFNVYNNLNHKGEESKALLNWLQQTEADVLCLQEFYKRDGHKVYNSEQILGSDRGFNSFVNTGLSSGGNFGLAIFSRFPIVEKGNLNLPDASKLNGAIYADVVTPAGTVRIINAHLESLSLDVKRIGASKKENFIARMKYLIGKMKTGYLNRSYQVQALVKQANQSPYPVIINADLNDTPYSYSYYTLNSSFKNSFRERGNGFGFSYNGELPFLRIDHQFYTKKLQLFNFETLTDKAYTDHYPIQGVYALPN